MNDERPRITVEIALYIVITIIAAWLRLSDLGLLPLTDVESTRALDAASMTPSASPYWYGGESQIPKVPAYHGLTVLVFQLIGATNGGARVISALAGIVLVWTPILARRRIGRLTALIMSALVVASPIFITDSRSAGGVSMAALGVMTSAMLLLGADSAQGIKARFPFAAAALGLTLASGTSGFQGLLSLGLAVVLARSTGSGLRGLDNSLNKNQLRQGLWIILGVLLFVASGAGFSVEGVAGFAESAGDWLVGWVTPGEMPLLTTMAILPIYEPLILFLGILGAVIAFRQRDLLGSTVAWWGIAGLLVVSAYPARQAGDLILVAAPLAYLAARTLVSLIEKLSNRQSWLEFFALTSTLLILVSMAYLRLVEYTSGMGLAFDQGDSFPRWFLVLGILFLSALAIVLFGLGWNWGLAAEASGFAVILLLSTMMVSAIWRLNFSSEASSAQNLWRPQTSTISLRLLRESLKTVSKAHIGHADSLEVQVKGKPTPSLAWAIRDFSPPHPGEDLMAEAPPALLMSEESGLQGYSADYIGQWLNISERWGWESTLPPELIKWLTHGEAPTVDEPWLMLVRVDIASLGESEVSASDTE